MITAEHRDAYARDGFVRLGRLLDEATVAALRAALADGLGPSPAPNPYGILRNNVWCAIRAFEEVVRSGKLADPLRELLGVPELVLFQDNLIWKPPGTRDRVEWHQDFAYWPLATPDGTTLWIALDAADVENGCMHFIPGTHREGERCPTDFVSGGRQPRRPDLPTLDWEAREHEAVAVPLGPGEALVHHPLLWHMSPPNLSTHDRRAYSVTWLTPECRWDPSHAPHPFNYSLNPQRGAPVEGPLFPRFS